MFNFAAGYYKVDFGMMINPDRYYVLSLSDMRRPVLLRFSCKNRELAERYIILKVDPATHDAIRGDKALEMGFKISRERLKDRLFPEKYAYPKGCVDPKKKKQHRTNFREKIRRTMNGAMSVKQFTVCYRGKIYTVHHYTINKAFRSLSKHSGMKWKHFIRRVETTPQFVTRDMVFIKELTLVHINQFNKIHGIGRIKYPPSFGKLWPIESPLLSIRRKKPKRLLL